MTKLFGSSMGEMTIEQRPDGWIICEDGRQIGGTLLEPFKSRKKAQRWLDRALADEAACMAEGDVSNSAKMRAVKPKGRSSSRAKSATASARTV
jgi:hypothetical protein